MSRFSTTTFKRGGGGGGGGGDGSSSGGGSGSGCGSGCTRGSWSHSLYDNRYGHVGQDSDDNAANGGGWTTFVQNKLRKQQHHHHHPNRLDDGDDQSPHKVAAEMISGAVRFSRSNSGSYSQAASLSLHRSTDNKNCWDNRGNNAAAVANIAPVSNADKEPEVGLVVVSADGALPYKMEHLGRLVKKPTKIITYSVVSGGSVSSTSSFRDEGEKGEQKTSTSYEVSVTKVTKNVNSGKVSSEDVVSSDVIMKTDEEEEDGVPDEEDQVFEADPDGDEEVKDDATTTPETTDDERMNTPGETSSPEEETSAPEEEEGGKRAGYSIRPGSANSLVEKKEHLRAHCVPPKSTMTAASEAVGDGKGPPGPTWSVPGPDQGPRMEHPLLDSWTLWYRSNATGMSWEDSQSEVDTFSTAEGFWRLYHHTLRPSELGRGCEYAIFRAGVRPAWEDVANVGGGRWLATMAHVAPVLFSEPAVDVLWRNFVLFMIGEPDRPATRQVNGAVMQVKARDAHRLGVWCRANSGRPELVRVGAEIRRSLADADLDGNVVVVDQQPEGGHSRRERNLFAHIGYEMHDRSQQRRARGSHSFSISA